MAGATNRALKSAGLPKSTIKTLRVENGGRLSLRSAISLAHERGLPVPDKAKAHLAASDAKRASSPEGQAASADFRAKAAERMKVAAAGKPAASTQAKKGGPAPGRISDLRKMPMFRKSGMDIRATPTVLKEYFAPQLSGVDVGRRKRMADLSAALGAAVRKASPGTQTVSFQVNALGEGGMRATGEHRKFTFKARLLKGKGEGGKDMVAINMIGGGKQRQAQAERATVLRGEAGLSNRGVVRENGALRIKGRFDASIPFRHRGETVYAVRDGNAGNVARVVRSDGSVVRNRDAMKRGARVVDALAARQKNGPSPAMQRAASNQAAASRATSENARRAALVAASASKRNRTNPTIQVPTGTLPGSVNANFTHRGQSYSVARYEGSKKPMVLDARGNPVRTPNKALRQRAERVMGAVESRIKAGVKPVRVVR